MKARRMIDMARRTLLARRGTLLRLSTSHRTDESELLAEREPDWEDLAAEVRDARVLGRLADGERRELQKIDAALDRIRDGRWGICESCGRLIPEARLRARPESSRCLPCTEDSEGFIRSA
jgi:RNA polymerase-binding protein DksA